MDNRHRRARLPQAPDAPPPSTTAACRWPSTHLCHSRAHPPPAPATPPPSSSGSESHASTPPPPPGHDARTWPLLAYDNCFGASAVAESPQSNSTRDSSCPCGAAACGSTTPAAIQLNVLDLHDNNFIGQIPPELGRLSRLHVLNLRTNSLQGSIPLPLVGCSNLTKLHLSDNRLQEYGAGNVISTNGDIYSYGILVLEMITGKRPTDNILTQGMSLREYVEMALHKRPMEIVDTRLCLSLNSEAPDESASDNRKIEAVISLLQLGLSCSEEMPTSRMPSRDIIKELVFIKSSILS
nr:unnamed protein product [Digitaria exilis]